MKTQLASLTTAQLRHAADLKDKIAALNQELAAIFGAPIKASAKTPKKGKMSAAGRANIIAAQKARWAKVKSTKPAAKAAGKKRKMSPAARAKIAAAQRARWAKVRAAAGKV